MILGTDGTILGTNGWRSVTVQAGCMFSSLVQGSATHRWHNTKHMTDTILQSLRFQGEHTFNCPGERLELLAVRPIEIFKALMRTTGHHNLS